DPVVERPRMGAHRALDLTLGGLEGDVRGHGHLWAPRTWRRSWVMRAVPSTSVSRLPPTAPISSARARGVLVVVHGQEISTVRVFCTAKMTSATPMMAAAQTPTQAGVVIFGALSGIRGVRGC